MSRPRTGSLGCLGVLAVLVQLAASVILVALVFRLDPLWLDALAFWRPPLLPRDELAVADRASREALGRENAASVATAPDEVETLPGSLVSASYEPARGATLASPDGARLTFPAGALGRATQVSLAAVSYLPRALAGPVAGPAYEIRIGAEPHATFARPLAVSVPYRPELFGNGAEPALAVFGGGRWQPLPTRVDAGRRTLSADLPHASVLGVLNPTIPAPVFGAIVGGAALAAAGYVMSANERELFWQAVYAQNGCSQTRQTQNFVIHSCAEGPHVVEAGLIDDVAERLERTISGLGSVGMPVPRPSLRKYHVFMGRTKAYGDTTAGGPLFFNARLGELARRDDLPAAETVRAVVAHEMVHVAQGQFFSFAGQHRHGWWLESSAAYLADLYWQKEQMPTDMAPRRWLRQGEARLLQKPMELTEDPEHYGYASLMRFMDARKPGAGLAFVQAVNGSGDASVASLDAAARQATGEGLGDLLPRYAQAFYHDDLWSGEMAPKLHRAQTPLFAALAQSAEHNVGSFAALTQVRGGKLVEVPWEVSAVGRLRHLSAAAFAVNVGPLARKGKLVVRAESGAPGTELWLGSGTTGGRLPGAGANLGFRRIDGSGVVENVRSPGGVDRITLVAVNPTLQDAGGVSVERWLLLPPEMVRFEREAERPAWTVTWDRVPLRDYPQAFSGYVVWRKKDTAPDSAFVRAGETGDQVFTDHPGDDASYVYTVTTRDVLGNESERAASESGDPFEGTWNGELRLVDGELVAPVMRALRQALLTGEGDETHNRALLDSLEKLLSQAQQAARLGLPMQFQLHRKGEGYEITVTRFVFVDLKPDGTPGQLRLVGPNTLAAASRQGGAGPEILLRRTREDEIRETGWTWSEPGDGERLSGTFAWKFVRERPGAGS